MTGSRLMGRINPMVTCLMPYWNTLFGGPPSEMRVEANAGMEHYLDERDYGSHDLWSLPKIFKYDTEFHEALACVRDFIFVRREVSFSGLDLGHVDGYQPSSILSDPIGDLGFNNGSF